MSVRGRGANGPSRVPGTGAVGNYVRPPVGPAGQMEEAYTVRPYTIVGSASVASASEVALEALIEGLVVPDVRLTPERRRILELTATDYQSVMELSARARLPVGVVRILVSELADAQKVRIHPPATASGSAGSPDSADTLSVLESVLNGIAAL